MSEYQFKNYNLYTEEPTSANHYRQEYSDSLYDYINTLRQKSNSKKDANYIIVVTNDVFQKIISTNKQCLPIKYRSYEIMRVDDYKNSIINYLR